MAPETSEATREGGPDVQLGGERLEPTPNQQIAQCNDCPPAMDAIDVFAPGADIVEKALRRRLAKAQAAGSARAERSNSDDARCLWWQASQVASAWTFARASKDELTDVLRAASMMFCAANVFERLEAKS